MLEQPSDRDLRELKDPMLSALLKDALGDDPALAAAPGRTDRIMRKVLASGRQPARRCRWAPFAWATGALATAAATVTLVFMTAHLPVPVAPEYTGQQVAVSGTDHSGASKSLPVTSKRQSGSTSAPIVAKVPTVQDKPETAWNDTGRAASKNTARNTGSNRENGHTGNTGSATRVETAVAAVDDSTMRAAAALYDAGTVAKSVGDFDGAYYAYQASYEVTPTPAALIASGTALEEMANAALEEDDLSI